ncbi:DUF6328 family protein [Streptomyces cinereoruber]|uniref:DUF6328 family protein n=1 Tax=Streptomyces cinereoruber TaxID=67260 RepID=UPI0036409744
MEKDRDRDGALRVGRGAPEAAHDRDARPDGRDETEDERADRRWGELLQELRVAQTGMQILFGFLLAVVFQPRFTELNDVDHAIFVVTVGFGAATVGALIGPVALHRLVSGKAVWIAAWWFAIPLWARHRAHRMSRD